MCNLQIGEASSVIGKEVCLKGGKGNWKKML